MSGNCRIIPAVVVKYPVQVKVNMIKRLQQYRYLPTYTSFTGQSHQTEDKKPHKVAKNKENWSMRMHALVTQPAILQPRCVNPLCRHQRVKENHPFAECNTKSSFYRYLCIGLLLMRHGLDTEHHHSCALLPWPLHVEEKVDLVFNSCLPEISHLLKVTLLFHGSPNATDKVSS